MTMRFGVKLMPQHCTWTDLLEVFRAADANPFYESAWTFDHFYPIYGDWEGPCLESWVTLSALAQATTRIRIGSMVNGAVYRHPAVVANMAAALDIVSNGRLDLGLGAGWNERECQAYGITLGSLRERFDRFEEAVQCTVALLRDRSVSFDGRYFTLRDARNEPKGPQRPHPPIVIGGGGEKRTLRIAARYAQHWNFPGGTVAEFCHKREVLHGHCASIGRNPNEITTSTHLLMWPNKTIDDVVRQAEAYAGVGLDVGIVYLEAPVPPTLIDDLARAFAQFAS
jgi:F420-dependent oxidoreductase-like protein